MCPSHPGENTCHHIGCYSFGSHSLSADSKQSIQIRGRTREQFPLQLPIRGLLAAQNLSPVRNFILKSQVSEKVWYFRDFVKLFLAAQNLSPVRNFILEIHITREREGHFSKLVRLYFVSKRNVVLKEDMNLAKKSSSQKTSALGCSCCRRLCRCCRCCLLLTWAAEEAAWNMEMLWGKLKILNLLFF